MQIQTKGEFGGLGLEVQEDEGHIKVVSPIDGTPAARAGIKPGDYIIAIDGKNIDGMTLNAAVDKMRGKPKTQITLTLIRLKEPKPIKVTLIREIIHIQVIKSALYDRIGYIRISQFNEETEKNMRQAFDKLQKESNHKLAGLVVMIQAGYLIRLFLSAGISLRKVPLFQPNHAILRIIKDGMPREKILPMDCLLSFLLMEVQHRQVKSCLEPCKIIIVLCS